MDRDMGGMCVRNNISYVSNVLHCGLLLNVRNGLIALGAKQRRCVCLACVTCVGIPRSSTLTLFFSLSVILQQSIKLPQPTPN